MIHSLLEWIDRVDFASQRGMAPPPFQTLDGDAIFPPQEQLWWLTELQIETDEDAKGDEDGPPSDDDDEAHAPDALTSDGDPLSEPELSSREPATASVVGAVIPHNPIPSWRGTSI